ncbi:MAG: aminotransferase class I/II-fold pyridoxal phosphate-dependent enzyme [Proteobacteria bacterium]|nr:aminotransferase class I/II-fold pyridoxal phosphate-dependent enzyme [Pseudomonadota bacterium]
MDPLAIELNKQIQEISPSVYTCLSEIGKQMFFPKGILTQSAEADQKASKFNATIGIAVENNEPMHLEVTRKYFDNLQPDEIYSYAPPGGLPELRRLWKEKLVRTNPSLKGKTISNPLVTTALTHGLCVAGDLFVDRGDVLIVPDKMWGVYKLNFSTRKGGKIVTFPIFDDRNAFNTSAFAALLKTEAARRDKLIVLLSFPNNPTGYTPSVAIAQEIYNVIENQAKNGTKIIAMSDDAYFGLFYEDSIKESLFAGLCDLHENIVAVKLDGATKESYAWGFRTGFITFGTKSSNPEKLYSALEMKVMGLVRSTISSSNHPAQTIVGKILEDPDYYRNIQEKYDILKGRARRLKEVLSREKFKEAWEYYPFNSGYFMCLKLHKVDAEQLRVHLLNKYGIGTISTGKTDLRIAFSCIEEDQIEELIDLIHQGVKDLS